MHGQQNIKISMEVQAVSVCGNQHGKTQDISEATIFSGISRYLAAFYVPVSLNLNYPSASKYAICYVTNVYLFICQVQSAGAYIVSLGLTESVLCDSECVKDAAVQRGHR